MFDDRKLQAKNGTSATISIGNWMALDCVQFLNIIPILGSIIAIVIYLVIAFSANTSQSMKNRVLASFVWLLIWLVAGAVFLFAFGGLAYVSSLAQNLPNVTTPTLSA